MNFRIVLAYDGTEYHGWQLQENQATVQGKLQEALLAIAGEPIVVHGAGRTDAGVHALGQVASFVLKREAHAQKLLQALNGNLPTDIRVLSVNPVSDEFHARFCAKRKTYRYQIWNAPVMNPLFERFAWHIRSPIQMESLHADTRCLLGTHDFAAFTNNDCKATSTVRTIDDISITRRDGLLEIQFAGKGFLRYQVRTMTAALAAAARSRLQMPLPEILRLQRRDLIRARAPAKGLTLIGVEY